MGRPPISHRPTSPSNQHGPGVQAIGLIPEGRVVITTSEGIDEGPVFVMTIVRVNGAPAIGSAGSARAAAWMRANGVGVGLGVPVGVGLGVRVGVGVGVAVAVGVGLGEGVGVEVGVGLGVPVGVGLGVRVGVRVGVAVAVGVGLGEGVGV
ncbi:hypothetical protein HRbin22_01248 [Candidatus Thermoflexus japonica]|uniref:Uncharacterized protein n=1 Tax=Candidatus Thermoflexus japonica TaxID=2035417 RepID=A0A2H5Y6B8_9CHLR|nr:hypothetical protein HRbin22_01248 [Candidatus Thermoflexus japonica]